MKKIFNVIGIALLGITSIAGASLAIANNSHKNIQASNAITETPINLDFNLTGFAGKGLVGEGDYMTATDSGITAIFNSGYYYEPMDVRDYSDSSITITCDSTIAEIVGITIVATKAQYNGGYWTLPDGVPGSVSSSSNSASWTGSGKTITLEHTAQIRVKYLYVTYYQSKPALLDYRISGYISASNTDDSWNTEHILVEGLYTGDSEYTDLSNKSTIVVNTPLPEITETKNITASVTATLNYDNSVTVTDTLEARLSYAGNYSIQKLYSRSAGELGDEIFYGLYMGYDQRDTYYDIFLGNGDYGIMLYGCLTSIPSSWEAYQTYLKVQGGYLKIYYNLYQVVNHDYYDYPITINEVTYEEARGKVLPVTSYLFNGDEQSNRTNLSVQRTASRPSSMTGTIVDIEQEINKNNGNYEFGYENYERTHNYLIDIQLENSKVAYIYVKKNLYTLDYDILEEELYLGNTITIKGFTSVDKWYYMMVLPEIVEEDESYTAESFSADLLSKTDGICSVKDHDNGDALASVWIDLQLNCYTKLVSSEKETLRLASASESGNTINKAMARYDHICVAYGLTNFIERDSADGAKYISVLNNNLSVVLIVVTSVASLSVIGAAILIYRKRAVK